MNKQSTTILIVLVLLTFGGLILVSNFISEKNPTETSLSAALVALSPKATPTPRARPVSSGTNIEKDLQYAQAQLDSLSDAIKNNDWTKAQTLFAGFELKERRLPASQLRHPDISPLLQDFFDLYVVQLERAVSEKQTKSANIAINQLVSIISETNARFIKRATPVEVQRLHHLVREIEFWKEAGDEKMLRIRTSALREAWNDVSPLVRARKQGEAVSQQFDELLSRAATVENPHEITALLPELTTNLEQIEALFQAGTRAPNDGNNPDGN